MNLKQKISESFSKAAGEYNKGATMQADIAARLVAIAKPCVPADAKILDLGSGTGFVAEKLGRKIIQSDIALGMCRQAKEHSTTICADMETLPFKDESFDIVLSSSSVQWTALEKTLSEAFRVLKPNGYFIFSTFGAETLAEISRAFLLADVTPKIHKFMDMHQHIELINDADFDLQKSESENIVIEFSSVKDVLSNIADIGAGTALEGEGRLTKEKLQLIENNFRKDDSSGKIKANWQVLYFVCYKPK